MHPDIVDNVIPHGVPVDKSIFLELKSKRQGIMALNPF